MAKTLVDKLDDTLTEKDAEILGYTQGDVETLPLVDTLAHTLARRRSKALTTQWLM